MLFSFLSDILGIMEGQVGRPWHPAGWTDKKTTSQVFEQPRILHVSPAQVYPGQGANKQVGWICLDHYKWSVFFKFTEKT